MLIAQQRVELPYSGGVAMLTSVPNPGRSEWRRPEFALRHPPLLISPPIVFGISILQQPVYRGASVLAAHNIRQGNHSKHCGPDGP
jgi:hypothetical protein